MTTIDAIEAIVTLAAADTDLAAETNNQIAAQHRYGQDTGDWPVGSKAAVFVPSATESLIHVQVQRQRFEVLCYGPTFADAGRVWQKVNALCRFNGKRVVTTGDGDALIYYLVVRVQPQPDTDDDLPRPTPLYRVIVEAEVAEQPVGLLLDGDYLLDFSDAEMSMYLPLLVEDWEI